MKHSGALARRRNAIAADHAATEDEQRIVNIVTFLIATRKRRKLTIRPNRVSTT